MKILFYLLYPLVLSIKLLGMSLERIAQSGALAAEEAMRSIEPYPFIVSKSEIEHYLQKMNIKGISSEDPILKSMINDDYAPFYKNRITPEKMHDIGESMKNTLVPLLIQKRKQIAAIFRRSKLTLSRFDYMFKFTKVNVDELIASLDFIPDKKLVEAFEIYEKSVNNEWSLSSISKALENADVILIWWDFKGMPKVRTFLLSEMKLAILNRKFATLLYYVSILNEDTLFDIINDRFKPDYLAKLTKDWIPDIERIDQELVYQLMTKLRREQDKVFSKNPNMRRVEQLEKIIENKFAIFHKKIEAKYGERGLGLAVHLQAMMDLENQVRVNQMDMGECWGKAFFNFW